MAKFNCTTTIKGKPALIGSVKSEFGTDAARVKWKGDMKLLPYPVPYCNAGTLEVLFQNIAHEHAAPRNRCARNWNDENDVILE